jgi:hypothetical protein
MVITSATAQDIILKPTYVQYSMDSITKLNFNKSLELLFSNISQGIINEELLSPEKAELPRSQLQELVNYETRKDSSAAKIQDKQLVNIYPISNDQYFPSLA